MVFVTEYCGCIYLNVIDDQRSEADTARLLADIRSCLVGSILVLHSDKSDLGDTYRVCTNGTREFVDFSPTLNALLDVLKVVAHSQVRPFREINEMRFFLVFAAGCMHRRQMRPVRHKGNMP